VNLAMVTGAPIRANAELFSVTAPGARGSTLTFAVATADIAAETQQQIAERHGPPAGGSESAAE
jgi:hypothetical protein